MCDQNSKKSPPDGEGLHLRERGITEWVGVEAQSQKIALLGG